jgi:hypothetical protein
MGKPGAGATWRCLVGGYLKEARNSTELEGSKCRMEPILLVIDQAFHRGVGRLRGTRGTTKHLQYRECLLQPTSLKAGGHGRHGWGGTCRRVILLSSDKTVQVRPHRRWENRDSLQDNSRPVGLRGMFLSSKSMISWRTFQSRLGNLTGYLARLLFAGLFSCSRKTVMPARHLCEPIRKLGDDLCSNSKTIWRST